jgi:uncharacterized membrane protein YidH (DUF202 family)
VEEDRRTILAGERTLLAWWRTGFTAIAVALAVGRLIPELAQRSERWPYTLLGIAFALYGIVMIIFGTRRIEALNDELGLPAPARTAMRSMTVLALLGVLLGAATIVLILFQ